jgi:hypothetical protein
MIGDRGSEAGKKFGRPEKASVSLKGFFEE